MLLLDINIECNCVTVKTIDISYGKCVKHCLQNRVRLLSLYCRSLFYSNKINNTVIKDDLCSVKSNII